MFKHNVVNGKPAVRFDATQLQFLNLKTPLDPSPGMTVLVVMKGAGTGTPDMASLGVAGIGTPDATDANFAPYQVPTGEIYMGAFGLYWNRGAMDRSVFRVYTSWIPSNIYAGTALFVNGVNQVLSSGGTASAWHVYDVMGRRNANYSTGDIAEIIAYRGTLSAIDRYVVESYLANKYGITLGTQLRDIVRDAFDEPTHTNTP